MREAENTNASELDLEGAGTVSAIISAKVETYYLGLEVTRGEEGKETVQPGEGYLAIVDRIVKEKGEGYESHRNRIAKYLELRNDILNEELREWDEILYDPNIVEKLAKGAEFSQVIPINTLNDKQETVQQGDGYGKIAERIVKRETSYLHRMKVAQYLELYNGIANDQLKVWDRISYDVHIVNKLAEGYDFYQVKKGDNLTAITRVINDGRDSNYITNHIREENSVVNNLIKEGQILVYDPSLIVIPPVEEEDVVVASTPAIVQPRHIETAPARRIETVPTRRVESTQSRRTEQISPHTRENKERFRQWYKYAKLCSNCDRYEADGQKKIFDLYRNIQNPNFIDVANTKGTGRITQVKKVVLHSTDGNYANLQSAKQAAKGIHAHFLITKDWKIIRNNVKGKLGCVGHAGNAQRDNLSTADFKNESIGIEVEARAGEQRNTAQYLAVKQTLKWTAHTYNRNLQASDILAHGQVACAKGRNGYYRWRKSDPYYLDRAQLGLPNNYTLFDPNVASGKFAPNLENINTTRSGSHRIAPTNVEKMTAWLVASHDISKLRW